MSELLNACGYLSVIYLLVGVTITARFYPGYSHSQQFMSELGAVDSPTHRLTPRINHYPLAIMFCLFGVSVLMLDNAGISERIAGASIIVHGLATAVAGCFAMDKDPYIETPSPHGQIHGFAGLLVMLSLLVAPIALFFSPRFGGSFHVFSIICILLTVIFLYTTVKSFNARKNAGLHQRLSYAAQLIWLAGLSITISVTNIT